MVGVLANRGQDSLRRVGELQITQSAGSLGQASQGVSAPRLQIATSALVASESRPQGDG